MLKRICSPTITSTLCFTCVQGEGTNYSFTAHTALHWAAAKGHAASVRWLLAAGASAAVLNASGATPLHAAADNQQLGCVEVLLLLGGADAQVGQWCSV